MACISSGRDHTKNFTQVQEKRNNESFHCKIYYSAEKNCTESSNTYGNVSEDNIQIEDSDKINEFWSFLNRQCPICLSLTTYCGQ